LIGLPQHNIFKSVEDRIHERPMFFNPYAFGSSVIGGWKELGRTTLGSSGDTIDVSSVADKRYYMILGSQLTASGGKIQSGMRLGNGSADSGTNYSNRYSQDGGADITGTSQNSAYAFTAGIEQDCDTFRVGYLANLSAKEKLWQNHIISQSAAGATTVPVRGEGVGKWVNTSNPIDYFRSINAEVGSYATGSELVILGWDDADTHTTNFWEQLADITGSASANISTGTVTAKKYLWGQIWYDRASTFNVRLQFNNDTASNYSVRLSDNGGADGTGTSQAYIDMDAGGTSGKPNFTNFFIINNSANEKLLMANTVQANTAGASNAPSRREIVGKWANTSAQITEIDFNTSTSTFPAGARLKLWGSN